MDQITADVTRVVIRRFAKIFKSVKEKDVIRSEKNVDILIGRDCYVLLSTKLKVGNFKLKKNQFGNVLEEVTLFFKCQLSLIITYIFITVRYW